MANVLFTDHHKRAVAHAARKNDQLAILFIDLDNFKQINDTRGHAVGDSALQHAARVIHWSLRKSDLCCRWGGEEFVVLLPDTSLEEACGVSEKLRATIAASPAATAAGELFLTASFGVAEGERSLEALIDRADSALYQAKNEGRNRVARAEPLAVPLPSPAAG